MRRRRTTLEARPVLEAALAVIRDADDDAAFAAALGSALGVEVEIGARPDGPAGVERTYDLRDPVRWGRNVRLHFPNPYDVPPEAELSDLVGLVSARIAELRRARARKLERRRARRRGVFAEALVGVTAVADVERLLQQEAVPRVAAGCRLLQRDDAEDGVELRIPDVGWPAVAYTGVVDDPQSTLLARDLADLALRAAAVSLDVEGELFARQVLERSLLPQALLPGPRVQLASRYRPAGGSSELAGGDFYDVLHRGDEAVLIVGDVQGKGVEAAALTSVARHTLRAAALRGLPPAAMLTLLNDVLLYGFEEQSSAGEVPMQRFMTAVVAHLRPNGTGLNLTVARAGHPPPIVLRRGGDAELLQPDGALLGVRPDLPMRHAETHLGLGDTLLLYTDGVTEQRDNRDPFDEHALARLVRGRSDIADLDGVAQLVLDTVLLVTRSHERDDIALVLARPS